MVAKPRNVVESDENNADFDADAAINQRLTQHLVENAIKDRSASVNISASQQPSSLGGMFQQMVAFVGVLGLMVVLSLMSRLDRKHKLL